MGSAAMKWGSGLSRKCPTSRGCWTAWRRRASSSGSAAEPGPAICGDAHHRERAEAARENRPRAAGDTRAAARARQPEAASRAHRTPGGSAQRAVGNFLRRIGVYTYSVITTNVVSADLQVGQGDNMTTQTATATATPHARDRSQPLGCRIPGSPPAQQSARPLQRLRRHDRVRRVRTRRTRASTSRSRPRSIDTAEADRDKHLRSADFFDVENYPTLTFASTSVTPRGGNVYDVAGEPHHPRRDSAQSCCPRASLARAQIPGATRSSFSRPN